MKVLPYMLMLTVVLPAACGGGEPDASDHPPGADQSTPEVVEDAGMATIVMTVPSMFCHLCVRSIRARLEEAGLEEIRIDLDTKVVRADFHPGRITSADVEALVEGQGFPVEGSRVLEARGVDGGGR